MAKLANEVNFLASHFIGTLTDIDAPYGTCGQFELKAVSHFFEKMVKTN